MADAHHHRNARGADRARHGFLVELPEVLDRAAAAHEQQHVALRARACARERRGDALGGAFTLHRGGIHDHLDRRVASRERRQHVAQRRRGKGRHHADRARVGRKLALSRGVEEPLALELVLQLKEALVERAEAGAAQRLDAQLEAAARLVEGRNRAHLDLGAIAQLRVEAGGAAAEHHAVHLRAVVLEGEVAMPRWRAREVGELAAHPGERKAPLERVAHAAQQLRYGEDRGLLDRCQEAARAFINPHSRPSGVRKRQSRPRSPIL